MNRPQLLTAVVLALFATVLAFGQDSAPVAFDPLTGLPVVQPDSLLTESEVAAPRSIDSGAAVPLNIDYDPLTGLPVATASPAPPRPVVPRRPVYRNAARMGVTDAKKNHSSLHWMMVGGMANIGAFTVGSMMGGFFTGSPGVALVGGVAAVSLATTTLSKVTDPVNVPTSLQNLSQARQNSYKTSYKTQTQKMRKTSAYAGTVFFGISALIFATAW